MLPIVSEDLLTELLVENSSEKASGRIAHWSTHSHYCYCIFMYLSTEVLLMLHWWTTCTFPRFHRLCRVYGEHCKGISLRISAPQNSSAWIGWRHKGGASVPIFGDLERNFMGKEARGNKKKKHDQFSRIRDREGDGSKAHWQEVSWALFTAAGSLVKHEAKGTERCKSSLRTLDCS